MYPAAWEKLCPTQKFLVYLLCVVLPSSTVGNLSGILAASCGAVLHVCSKGLWCWYQTSHALLCIEILVFLQVVFVRYLSLVSVGFEHYMYGVFVLTILLRVPLLSKMFVLQSVK